MVEKKKAVKPPRRRIYYKRDPADIVEIIREIPRGVGSKIVVQLLHNPGGWFLDTRKYIHVVDIDVDDKWMPCKQGISLKKEFVPDYIRGLMAAYKILETKEETNNGAENEIPGAGTGTGDGTGTE